MLALLTCMLSCSSARRTGDNSGLVVVKKWELPPVLREISGIDYIDKDRFACVQDEEGKIFIYNAALNKIEKEIVFSLPADYEGIALVKTTAYIMHANGEILEIKKYNSKKMSIIQHQTFLTARENVEGICYDRRKNRLLVSVKRRDPNSSDYKGIYAFDLKTKKLDPHPVYKIVHDSDSLKDQQKVQPSDLAVHPKTGDLYVLDGEHPRLFVMSGGKIKKIYQLDSPDFPLPEGICFSRNRDLYICNEGRSGKGNILKVREN